jgi:hypothetical protein
MANGQTMFRVPIMSQKNIVHTSTKLNGRYEIEVMTAHPIDGRKNINHSGNYNHQNDKVHVIHSTVSKNHTEEVPGRTIYSNKITTLHLHESHKCLLFTVYCKRYKKHN